MKPPGSVAGSQEPTKSRSPHRPTDSTRTSPHEDDEGTEPDRPASRDRPRNRARDRACNRNLMCNRFCDEIRPDNSDPHTRRRIHTKNALWLRRAVARGRQGVPRRLRPAVRPQPQSVRPYDRPRPPPCLHPGRLSLPPTRLAPPSSCVVSVSVAGFVLAPRMRLRGSVCARHCRAQTDPRGVPKAARRSSGAAARVGPFPGSPGLAGRAFRARAAPGPARARARMREAEFGRSGDAAFGPFSPEVEIPEKLFDAARTPKNMQPMPSNADNCRTFRYAPQPRSVTAAWRSHHWSAGPKAAAGIRPCRLVIERHNSGAWIRAKTSAQGAENGLGWRSQLACSVLVLLCVLNGSISCSHKKTDNVYTKWGSAQPTLGNSVAPHYQCRHPFT